MIKVAIDTHILAYAEGINGAAIKTPRSISFTVSSLQKRRSYPCNRSVSCFEFSCVKPANPPTRLAPSGVTVTNPFAKFRHPLLDAMLDGK